MRGPPLRVTALCDEALARLRGGPSREKVALVKDRLAEPLRVAIAGRVGAGKSTLVNALLERQIAPTAAGECTRLVTWFRYGIAEKLELRLRGGAQVRTLSLTDDGYLPNTLGEPLEAIESITVYLSSASLRDLTIIDTPGLSSGNEEYSAETAALLARNSQAAVSEADALIYVVTQDVKADDRAVVTDFRGHFGGSRASVANTVGVLNKADKIGGGPGDPLARAQQVADRYARALSSVLNDVIPVVGLLAETAATQLSNSDAHHLGVLADLGEDARRQMLVSARRFKTYESPVPAVQHKRLHDLLNLYGLERSLGLIDRGVRGAAGLSKELRSTSGVDQLRRLVDDTFRRNADCLKAEVALAELERIAYSPVDTPNADVLSWLRSRLDDLRQDPGMHELNEVWAVQEASTGAVDLPPDLEADLHRLVMGSTPAGKLGLEPAASAGELQRAAADGASRWAAFVNERPTSLVQARIARVADRSYAHLWSQTAARQKVGMR